MRKVDFSNKILCGDGIEHDKKYIEDFFTDLFEQKIYDNLKDLKNNKFDPAYPREFADYIDKTLDKLHDILIASPQDLELIKIEEDRKKESWRILRVDQEICKKFYSDIHTAFNYKVFRKNLLNRFAVLLNVKACLYCNQQYTIAIGKTPDKAGEIKLSGSKAFLQFDHFYGESEYPIMSMSLYNLIPSCPICNQKKSKGHISLKLHPYVNDLSSNIMFRVKSMDAFLNPIKPELDLLEVEIDCKGDKDIQKFVKKLDLERRYSRHLDIVQEIEVALYMSRYYDNNFADILSIFSDGSHCSPEWHKALLRHFKGFYTDPDDINKRPLTKFSQDIYNQLRLWHKEE